MRAFRACGRHATSESASLVAGHRFPRDVILLAVRYYYLQLGAAAELIAGILADRGIDVSGRTVLRWVQKFGRLCLTRSVDTGNHWARHGWWTRRTSRSRASGTTRIAALIRMGRCSTAGCHGRATWLPPEAFFRRAIGSTG